MDAHDNHLHVLANMPEARKAVEQSEQLISLVQAFRFGTPHVGVTRMTGEANKKSFSAIGKAYVYWKEQECFAQLCVEGSR